MALPPLSRSLVLQDAYQQHPDITVPTEAMLALPEKVLQFGTGGFLRAFADFFIDEANRKGLFNGRICMVGSTGSKRTQWLNEQDGLYTLRIQGLKEGKAVEAYRVIGSVSRALAAKTQWDRVVEVAKSPDLEIIISNTTEVGIAYDPDDQYVAGEAPRSFPGKLAAVLYERARHVGYDPGKGLVVLPSELITKNGDVLQSIVLQLAGEWDLGSAFVSWLEQSVFFCNTLVDRIVPGMPSESVLEEIYTTLAYRDHMLTSAEVYRLWPIEGAPEALERLTFAQADSGIVLTDDIHPFKERKVRILNGSHTSSVPIAFLAGEQTVLGMMQNPRTRAFVQRVMLEEIVPSLDVPDGEPFAKEVLDRFSNPYLHHRLIDITLQSTSKWRLRLLPSIQRFYEKTQQLPRHLCAGFAAYLVFMRGVSEHDGQVQGTWQGETYPIRDDQAPFYKEAWSAVDIHNREQVQAFVQRISEHHPFWGDTLSSIPGFSELVGDYCFDILHNGVLGSWFLVPDS